MKNFFIGVLAGLFGGIPTIFYGFDAMINNIRELGLVYLITSIILSLIIAIFCLFKEKIFDLTIGKAKGLITEAFDAASEAVGLFHDGKKAEAAQATIRSAREFGSWWATGQFYRLIFEIAIGILLAFAGTLGVIIAHKQTQLFDQQSRLIDAQRRAGLVGEMSSILDGFQHVDVNTSNPVNPVLKSRVSSFIKLAQPYQEIDPITLKETGKITSPERDYLISSLGSAGLRIDQFVEQVTQADFSKLDLSGSYFGNITIEKSLLNGTDLSEIVLDGHLVATDLSDSFIELSYIGSNFKSVNMKNSSIRFSNFDFDDVDGMDISNSEVLFSQFILFGDIVNMDMRDSLFFGVSFPSDASFSNVLVQGANISASDIDAYTLGQFTGRFCYDPDFPPTIRYTDDEETSYLLEKHMNSGCVIQDRDRCRIGNILNEFRWPRGEFDKRNEFSKRMKQANKFGRTEEFFKKIGDDDQIRRRLNESCKLSN